MSWVLRTKRVPVCRGRPDGAAERAQNDGGIELEQRLPDCAGIGDADQDAWLCKDCVLAHCVREPRMPPLALANCLFGGRLRPLYRDITLAMRAALGPGRPLQRMLVLRDRGEDQGTLQKGFPGNVVLVAQPSSEKILGALPPDEKQIPERFNIFFNTKHEEIAEQPGLAIPRRQYIECAELRRRACPCSANSGIDHGRAKVELAEEGVPRSVQQLAMQMSGLDSFLPNLLGPASRRDPCAKTPDTDEEGGDDLVRDGAKGETAEAASEEVRSAKGDMDDGVGERRCWGTTASLRWCSPACLRRVAIASAETRGLRGESPPRRRVRANTASHEREDEAT